MSIILHEKRRSGGTSDPRSSETRVEAMLRNFRRTPRLRRLGLVLTGAVLLALTACSRIPGHPRTPVVEDQFSEAVVRAHLDNLARLGPRLPGSETDLDVRTYLEREFEIVGVPLAVLEQGGSRHLVGVIPGESDDRVLLVTSYAALGSNEWVDDSGAVLLLELTRVLARGVPPYTVQIALAETRPRIPDATTDPNPAKIGPLEARQRVFQAGVSLGEALERTGALERLRVVVAFEPRAAVTPRMARDLRSHPVFRSLFWEVAAELGQASAFPPDGGWRSPLGLQAAFRSRGLGQVLALVDETTARIELQAGPRPAVSADSGESVGLEAVGQVTLEALSRLMNRFERIDAFSR